MTIGAMRSQKCQCSPSDHQWHHVAVRAYSLLKYMQGQHLWTSHVRARLTLWTEAIQSSEIMQLTPRLYLPRVHPASKDTEMLNPVSVVA